MTIIARISKANQELGDCAELITRVRVDFSYFNAHVESGDFSSPLYLLMPSTRLASLVNRYLEAIHLNHSRSTRNAR